MNLTDFTELPGELRSAVEAELQAGERVAWSDQPIPSRRARSTLPFVLFAIPWTAFAIFWMVSAAKGTSSTGETGIFRAFPLFGLPFVLIGLGMLSKPYWVSRKAKKTVYILTDRRAIVFETNWRGTMNVRSFTPDALTDLRRKQYKDGSGDVIFTQDWQSGSEGSRYATDVGFLAVRDVKSVEEMVRAFAQKITA